MKQQLYIDRKLEKVMKDALIRMGLNGQEADVYNVLAKYDRISASHLAKLISINRSVVYSILNSLKEKGLVSEFLIQGVKQFSVTKPEALMSYVRAKEDAAKEALASLKKLEKDNKDSVQVEVYQGVQGGLAVLKDILATGKDYAAFGEDEQFQKLFGTLAEQYIRQLKEKRIRERLLVPRGGIVLASKYSEVRHLPKDIELPSISVIYGSKVAFAIFQKPYYAIVIESEDLARTYQSIFECLWKIARV